MLVSGLLLLSGHYRRILRAVEMAVPCRVHAGSRTAQATAPIRAASADDEIKRTVASGELFQARTCEYTYTQLDIGHKLAKLKQPRSNVFYNEHDQLRRQAPPMPTPPTLWVGVTPYQNQEQCMFERF